MFAVEVELPIPVREILALFTKEEPPQRAGGVRCIL